MQHFRDVCDLEINFEPDLTVIIGRNGAGKTSVLDALASFMELFLISVKGLGSRATQSSISPEDMQFGTNDLSLQIKIEIEDPHLRAKQQHSFEIGYDGGSALSSRLMRDVLLKLSKEVAPKLNFVYYRQNRAFPSDAPISRRDSERVFDPDYLRYDFLDTDLREIRDLQTWWDRRDAQEARIVRDQDPDYRDPQLEAIRTLIKKIDTFKDISYSSTASMQGLYLTKRNDASVHVSRLSSGERSYIVLLADLARRLQIFEPRMPLGKISAIVLIDEIELNLHPTWQSEIAPTLIKVFPACQFIIATHSPQVLSGVESQQVRILEIGSAGETKLHIPLSTKGRTSNYLLEGVFRSSERYPPIEQLITDFNLAIDQRQVADAEAKLKVLEQEIGEDTPTLLVLRKRLKNSRTST